LRLIDIKLKILKLTKRLVMPNTLDPAEAYQPQLKINQYR